MRNNNSNSKVTIVKESYSQNLIGTIINAAKKRLLITIHYYSNEKGLTVRDIEPMDVLMRLGRKNLVGWCRLRNDWRTFRLDRINYIVVHLGEKYTVRDDYKREDFEDEGAVYSGVVSSQSTSSGRPNKEFAFNTDNIKTMSENKLNFSDDDDVVKEYSDDEEDMAL